MEFLETPAERFERLPRYPFEPHYHVVDERGLRMHYVDEGPRGAPVLLMLHGEPSWSYLYRFMIPRCVAAGFRVIAPDLIGFGKSSKPTELTDYTYQRHCDWVTKLLLDLDLSRTCLFGQDWGSLIGLRIAAELEPRFVGAVIANGFLPSGNLPNAGFKGALNAAAFLTWRTFAQYSPVFPTSAIITFGTHRTLSESERRAYDAPFPDARYMAGARAFPGLVPLTENDPAVPKNRAAWEVLERWEKPFVTCFSTGDPITRGLDRTLQRRIPGARGRTHERVPGGHFLQEDSSDKLSEVLCATAREGLSALGDS